MFGVVLFGIELFHQNVHPQLVEGGGSKYIIISKFYQQSHKKT